MIMLFVAYGVGLFLGFFFYRIYLEYLIPKEPSRWPVVLVSLSLLLLWLIIGLDPFGLDKRLPAPSSWPFWKSAAAYFSAETLYRMRALFHQLIGFLVAVCAYIIFYRAGKHEFVKTAVELSSATWAGYLTVLFFAFILRWL